MPVSRLTSLCALVLLAAALTAGCSSSSHATTSSALATCSTVVASAVTQTSPTTGVSLTTTTSSVAPSSSTAGASSAATLGPNDRRQVAAVSWSPAETIPAADLKTITETLASYGQRMLFPSRVPVAGTGRASAEFHAFWTPPTGVVDLYVMSRTEDGAVDVTLISSTDYSRVVGWGLETIPGAVPVTVRGLSGRSYPRTDQSRPMLYWQEEGQHFVASYRGFLVEPAMQQMIDWLDSWYMLP
jgi:hypothetical protein